MGEEIVSEIRVSSPLFIFTVGATSPVTVNPSGYTVEITNFKTIGISILFISFINVTTRFNNTPNTKIGENEC